MLMKFIWVNKIIIILVKRLISKGKWHSLLPSFSIISHFSSMLKPQFWSIMLRASSKVGKAWSSTDSSVNSCKNIRINLTTPGSKHLLVFLTQYFLPQKRAGLKDFCLIFEMEEWLASEAHKIKILQNQILKLQGIDIKFW